MEDVILQIIQEEISRGDRLEQYVVFVEEMVDEVTGSSTVFIGQTPLDMAKEYAKKAFIEIDGDFHPDKADLEYVSQAAFDALVNSGQIKKMSNKYNTASGKYLPSGRFGMSFM